MIQNRNCEGCGNSLSVIDLVGGYRVCMDCTKARAKAVQASGRCKCGPKRIPGEELSSGGVRINGNLRGQRRWIPCRRCLGTIKQTS